MKVLKKNILVVASCLLIFNFLQGAEKKKNINKYIFAGGEWLVVFDGATKTIQKRKFSKIPKGNKPPILYYPKLKKIILVAEYGRSLYSINVNNLNDSYQVDLSQFNRHGKAVNFVHTGIDKCRHDKNTVFFSYNEWSRYDFEFFVGNADNQRLILWNLKDNTFKETFKWEYRTDDPHASKAEFNFYKLKSLHLYKKFMDEIPESAKGREKRSRRWWKRNWKYGKKFKKLLKKGKINVGNYNKPNDLRFSSTGARYMVVRNDKLYLVHMKTKKVYTLMDNPWMTLRYFIIEKNEDDLDLDAE